MQCECIKPHPPCASVTATPMFLLVVTMNQITSMATLIRNCVHVNPVTLNGKELLYHHTAVVYHGYTVTMGMRNNHMEMAVLWWRDMM